MWTVLAFKKRYIFNLRVDNILSTLSFSGLTKQFWFWSWIFVFILGFLVVVGISEIAPVCLLPKIMYEVGERWVTWSPGILVLMLSCLEVLLKLLGITDTFGKTSTIPSIKCFETRLSDSWAISDLYCPYFFLKMVVFMSFQTKKNK